ncbi:hypothetical protein [Nonomuraea sp. NPDC001023]|uniref:hypothetical protein n=1 Tax=unclassified Nonomuraea TaxID=2593643 RepID=UPI00332DE304
MFLRIALAAQTVALLLQAVTAGLLLSTPGGRAAHSATALAVAAAVLLYLVAAVMTKQRAAILPAVGMLVATLVQMALGMAHVKGVHVPLGVLMFGGSMVQTTRVWSAGRLRTTSA